MGRSGHFCTCFWSLGVLVPVVCVRLKRHKRCRDGHVAGVEGLGSGKDATGGFGGACDGAVLSVGRAPMV